jgi:hypothetical protein
MRHLVLAPLFLLACATYRQELQRGSELYDAADYERALATFRALEPDFDSLTPEERTRYAYLRGMTGFRLGYRPHARHWLGLGVALEGQYPGGLSEGDLRRAKEALTELNREVYGVGLPEAPSTEAKAQEPPSSP